MTLTLISLILFGSCSIFGGSFWLYRVLWKDGKLQKERGLAARVNKGRHNAEARMRRSDQRDEFEFDPLSLRQPYWDDLRAQGRRDVIRDNDMLLEYGAARAAGFSGSDVANVFALWAGIKLALGLCLGGLAATIGCIALGFLVWPRSHMGALGCGFFALTFLALFVWKFIEVWTDLVSYLRATSVALLIALAVIGGGAAVYFLAHTPLKGLLGGLRAFLT